MKIAVIGSGLAGVSVARALADRGLNPVVLDVGDTDEPHRYKAIQALSKKKPEAWDSSSKELLFTNPSLKEKSDFPKKLSFGSDFFYGKSLPTAEVKDDGIIPPFSYTKGGFSVGWGASILPPDDHDIQDWPIQSAQLKPYYQKVLDHVPYSAQDDGLSRIFPLYSKNFSPLRLTPGNEKILARLNRIQKKLNPDEVVFGQGRLLTQASTGKENPGCQYCGQCLSGCVYDCIYKAGQTLDQLLREGKVQYQKNTLVDSLEEQGTQVKIYARVNGEQQTLLFDRVFLAAGSVNTTRIILKSKKIHDVEVPLLANSGFVVPMLSIRRLPTLWPSSNTQPGLFLEFKAKKLSNHWVHTQLSTPNELVYEMLNIREVSGLVGKLKKMATEHMVLAHCNIHSNHSNSYLLKLDQNNVLHSRRQDLPGARSAHQLVKDEVTRLGRKFGCYVLKPMAQHSIRGGGFHVGGTLPMSKNPQTPLETNLVGNPQGWSRIHVVDSSVFPSLPATTIGLVAMANATRIGTETPL